MKNVTNETLRNKWRWVKVHPHAEEWDDQEAFREWCLSNGYEPGLSLFCRDPSLPYGPENCYWRVPERNDPAQSWDAAMRAVWDKLDPPLTEAEAADFMRRWNTTVNLFRESAGLPLFDTRIPNEEKKEEKEDGEE